jgi:hypothetical protein
MYLQLLNGFAENDYKYFETCLAKMKKSRSLNLKNFLNENLQLKLKILENTDSYEYLDDAIGSSELSPQKIKFSIENDDASAFMTSKLMARRLQVMRNLLKLN